MVTMTAPFLTDMPSRYGRDVISPKTSGVIFTSTSGWTLPVAVTTWTIVFVTAFSVVIAMPVPEARFFTMPMAMKTPRTTVAPMTHHFILDFRRGLAAVATGTFPGEREAVIGGAFTGNGLWVKCSCRSRENNTWGGRFRPPHANTTNNGLFRPKRLPKAVITLGYGHTPGRHGQTTPRRGQKLHQTLMSGCPGGWAGQAAQPAGDGPLSRGARARPIGPRRQCPPR